MAKISKRKFYSRKILKHTAQLSYGDEPSTFINNYTPYKYKNKIIVDGNSTTYKTKNAKPHKKQVRSFFGKDERKTYIQDKANHINNLAKMAYDFGNRFLFINENYDANWKGRCKYLFNTDIYNKTTMKLNTNF